MLAIVRRLWAYRGFIGGSVRRELQLKYRNSVLGALWSLLHPAAMVTIYTLVFTQVMRARLPGLDATWGYSIYLCAGLFAWGLFAEIVTRAQTVFIDHANLMKKSAFPRLSLPVVIVGSAIINHAILFGLLGAFVLAVGHGVDLPVLLLPLLFGVVALFAVGLGIVMGVVHVFFRDVGPAMGVVLGFWFWLTPVVYPTEIIPESFREVVAWNPLAVLVGAFQEVVVFGRWPAWGPLGLVTGLGVLFCLAAVVLFRRKAGAIMDEL